MSHQPPAESGPPEATVTVCRTEEASPPPPPETEVVWFPPPRGSDDSVAAVGYFRQKVYLPPGFPPLEPGDVITWDIPGPGDPGPFQQ